ncbi:hypothetical protein Hanom_Chr13g01213601 [Helianthus anomalus]
MGASPEMAAEEPILETSFRQELLSEDPVISVNHGDISYNLGRSHDLVHDSSLHGYSKILEKENVHFVGGEKNKRKKYNRTEYLGRPNEDYVSSKERPTKGKKGSNDDPFGIDSFIWAREEIEEVEKSDSDI